MTLGQLLKTATDLGGQEVDDVEFYRQPAYGDDEYHQAEQLSLQGLEVDEESGKVRVLLGDTE